MHQGESTMWIKSKLDHNVVEPRRKKGLWSLGSSQQISRRSHYIGTYTWKDKKSGKVVTCTSPSIIDETLWNEVQKKQKSYAVRSIQIKRTFFLRILFSAILLFNSLWLNINKHFLEALNERNQILYFKTNSSQHSFSRTRRRVALETGTPIKEKSGNYVPISKLYLHREQMLIPKTNSVNPFF